MILYYTYLTNFIPSSVLYDQVPFTILFSCDFIYVKDLVVLISSIFLSLDEDKQSPRAVEYASFSYFLLQKNYRYSLESASVSPFLFLQITHIIYKFMIGVLSIPTSLYITLCSPIRSPATSIIEDLLKIATELHCSSNTTFNSGYN